MKWLRFRNILLTTKLRSIKDLWIFKQRQALWNINALKGWMLVTLVSLILQVCPNTTADLNICQRGKYLKLKHSGKVTVFKYECFEKDGRLYFVEGVVGISGLISLVSIAQQTRVLLRE